MNINAFDENPYVLVLGTAQDGGYPQTGCSKICCKSLFDNNKFTNYVSSIALVIPNECYLFDCTPDFKYQLNLLNKYTSCIPSGIYLTHAHMGHYTGLINLGRESMNTSNMKVHAFEKMSRFLKNNAPFSQLVLIKNISLNLLKDKEVNLINNDTTIEPFLVDHRGEFSETCGFRIKGKNKSLIFIPDIDNWDNVPIKEFVSRNDFLLLDGTFYSNKEINFRDVKEIPHPFIEDSVKLFDQILSLEDRNKIYFTHLNHTNPLWNKESDEYANLIGKGYRIAEQNQIFRL